MVDIPANRASLYTTDARTRKRRRAEFRLRAYGIGAISLAALALVALLGSVVFKATGAMRESYITLPVEILAEKIDPSGERDPKAIRTANFGGLTKDLLKATFPQVTARKVKRQLYDLVSSGASFELAERVSGDPSLVGQIIDNRFLASDITDLYLKGAYGALIDTPVSGALSVLVNGDEAQISTSSNDFATALAQVKSQLIVRAQAIRTQAAMQDAGVQDFSRRAAAATDEASRAEYQAQAIARAVLRDTLIAQAEDLESRARGNLGAEALDRTNQSLLVKVAGGWIKIISLDKNVATGVVLQPLTGAVQSSPDWSLFTTELPEDARKVSDNQIVWIEVLREAGAISQVFNTRFFTSSDSREPELAGIKGAAIGTVWTMLVTFALAFPIGVISAIYLEEFARKNRLTNFIEVNINNLAAVPSIVFGLLGLSVFLGVFGVPRSAPLAGGIVLALMTLPTIIIAARAAIRAVPPSIRDAAFGVGASNLQASFHHVLPLAMPGILTGTILGMAQALGETAPLIMIGMVAFIVDIPTGITDSATVLPVQVFLWSDFPERAFEARTSAAICVLLTFLVIMNAAAIILRRRFERRW